METAFTPGQNVYNARGDKARYVSLDEGGGHVVVPYVVADDDTEDGLPEWWRRVYSEPPREVLNTEIASLQTQAEILRSELTTLRLQERTKRWQK